MSQAKDFYISCEQFEDLDHYNRMFELAAEQVKLLCQEERDDIVYGFELGELHSMLRDKYTGMMEIVSQIRSQVIENKK